MGKRKYKTDDEKSEARKQQKRAYYKAHKAEISATRTARAQAKRKELRLLRRQVKAVYEHEEELDYMKGQLFRLERQVQQLSTSLRTIKHPAPYEGLPFNLPNTIYFH